MKVALTSDLHLGITSEKTIRTLLSDVAQQCPDVYINAGDYSGGFCGWRKLRQVVKWEKAVMPDTHRISVLGNHDYWVRGRKRKDYGYHRPSPGDLQRALTEIATAFREAGTCWLDTDGPYAVGNYIFFGHTGWYAFREHTNDWNFLPEGLAGNTQDYMTKLFEDTLHNQLKVITDRERNEQLVCITHMPIIGKYQGSHMGRISLGEMLMKEYGVKYFFNGHMHERHEGPVRFEAGSDYYRPRYQIINLPDGGGEIADAGE